MLIAWVGCAGSYPGAARQGRGGAQPLDLPHWQHCCHLAHDQVHCPYFFIKCSYCSLQTHTCCDSCCPWAVTAVAGAAADCCKLSQHCLCHMAIHGLAKHQLLSCSHSNMAMHGLATHLSSLCGHSSSEECISYALLSSLVPSFGSSCVCLSTINTPPQSHARPDQKDNLDSLSTALFYTDSFQCDSTDAPQELCGAC